MFKNYLEIILNATLLSYGAKTVIIFETSLLSYVSITSVFETS
jgi:hypothetical protein